MNIIDNYNYNLTLKSYPFIEAVINIFDNNFILLSKKLQKSYINNFINTISYKIMDYKNIKKSIKNYTFLNLKKNIIDNNSKQFISIFFEINIMILINKNYYFLNKYNNSFGTIILIYNIDNDNNNKFIPIKNLYTHLQITELFNNCFEEIIFNNIDDTCYEKSCDKFIKKLSQLKLNELQNFIKHTNLNYNNMNKKNICDYIKHNILNL